MMKRSLKRFFGTILFMILVFVNGIETAHQLPKNKEWINRSTGIDFGGITCMAFHPENNSIIFAGTKIHGLFLGTRYTTKWQSVSLDIFDRLWINCIVFDPHHHNRIFIGTQKGLFISEDLGNSWNKRIGSAMANQIHSIAFHPTDVNTIFIGSFEDGIMKSTDGGRTWSTSNDKNLYQDMRVNAIVFNPDNPSQLFAGLAGNGVLVSEDTGTSWQYKNTGLYDLSVFSLICDPLNPSILYCATAGGLFKSEDFAEKWSPVNKGLTTVWKEIYCIAINPVRTSELYLGSNNGFIYYTSDSAESWSVLPQIKSEKNSTDVWTYSIILDPLHPNMLYAGTNIGIYRYRNSNASMTDSLKLDIINPQNNEIIHNPYVLISGLASDNEFGLDMVLINKQRILFNDYGYFESWIPLQFGKNEISISAVNNDDYAIVKKITVTGIIDSTLPVMNLFYPESSSFIKVNSDCINIIGQVFDPESGIDSILINNQPVWFNGNGEFQKSFMLNKGQNALEITVMNCAKQSITVRKTIYSEFSKITKPKQNKIKK